jgi:hypothetical protein
MMNRREARYASVDLLLDSGYQWLARDLNGSIAAYSHKPFKLDDEVWYYEIGESKDMWMWVDDGDLYNFVKWEDEEPVNIREWLEKEEEEMKMYSVKDGELECREVDQDDCGESTPASLVRTPASLVRTPVSLVTSDEVELDQDNLSETTLGSLSRFPYPMATEGLVLAETDWFTDSSTYDAESMYPPKQLSLADLDNVKVHDRICLELNNIYEKKNADYGNSFENSLDKHGLIAGIVRMDDKMSRLISLNSKNEQQVLDESLRDTLMDLANYAIMSVMWLDEQ